MERETTLGNQVAKKKVFKDKEIRVGTFFGGTLFAGYMAAQNFKAFGEKDKARNAWIVAVIATALLFFISFYAPYIDRLPRFLFPLVYTGIAVVLMQMYQGEKIRNHLRTGGKIQGWRKTVAVTLIGMVVTIIIVLGAAFLIDSIADRET